MTPYAATTKVTPEKTQLEIRALVRKHGATSFGAVEDKGQAVVAFRFQDRSIRFYLPLPTNLTQQQTRSRWRNLFLAIKAKLESIASGIETFDEAFLAHIVMPDGDVYSRYAVKALAAAAEGKPLPPLLEGPKE